MVLARYVAHIARDRPEIMQLPAYAA